MKSILFTAALLTLCAVALGCSRKLVQSVQPNQAPTVALSTSRLPTTSEYQYRVQWTGSDPDGRVDHYLVAVNPPSVDRVDEHWASTREQERLISFPLSAARSAVVEGVAPTERTPQVITVRAVDDRGAMSEARSLGLFADNIPPTVHITFPAPGRFANPVLPPTIRFEWDGLDPDGQFTTRPVKYKYLLMNESSVPPIDNVIADPDSLRRYYAPEFAGWDSTSAETTQVQFTGLAVGHRYLFVVVAFDEAGDYSPVFALESNMLRFNVGFAKFLGPRLTLFNESFKYTYPGGGYQDDPMAYVNVEIPEQQVTTFSWFGTPVTGLGPVIYRWALDPNDIYDETPRSDPSDLGHWSPPSSNATGATVGPFSAGLKGVYHRLYVEARDGLGNASLGIINLIVTRASFDHELLIVDDTRLTPDNYLPSGCADRPRGAWPTAAELDTFLYARGGVPWRCYPVGTMSTPGLFDGYSYDTLGTRGMLSEPPLSALGRYRHVIWYTDGRSATYFRPLTDPAQPQSVLRYMSSSARANTLASYSKAGGDVWVAGGGGAYASQISSDDPSNNVPTTTFSSITGRNHELGPGRFMYEILHWQSEIRVSNEPAIPKRFRGRFEAPQDSTTDPAHWVPYWKAPRQLDKKNTAPSDPLPPLRTTAGDFYKTTFDFEYLQVGNYIIEGLGGDPEAEASTLDSLYEVDGGGLPPNVQNPNNVVMTYYHGPHGERVVFSGFNFWSFRRDGCVQLVDFVLQQIWHLSRESDTKFVRRAAVRRPTP
jgi:hypothetical protein